MDDDLAIPEDTSELPFERFVEEHGKHNALKPTNLFRVEVFCNIKRFDLKEILGDASQLRPSYNSVMLLLAFYSRLFARLKTAQEVNDHKRARNLVGHFFAPLEDPEAPMIGLRELLAFTSDFGVFLPKRKVQRLWLAAVGTWDAKVGLTQFMRLLCLMGDLCFEDAAWETKTETQRVKRFVRHFGLADFKVLKSKLFDIYRDKYIYMYSEYENFSSILRKIDVLAVPSHSVEPLKLKDERRYDEAMKFLNTLVLVNRQETWERYQEVAALDFGVLKVNAPHEYRIDVYNTCHFLLSVDVDVHSVLGIDPLEIKWNGFKRLSPGCSLSLNISMDTKLATDWFGFLRVIVRSAAGEFETLQLPCYCRVSEDVASSHLPSLGITPFSSRIPSAQLVRFDPTRTDNLRPRRPGSALTSRPNSAPKIQQDRPQRPLSSAGPRTATQISRPASGLPRRPLTATQLRVE